MGKKLDRNKYDISLVYGFLKCPHCSMIFNDLSLTEIEKKCPNCGEAGPREMFPSGSQISLIKTIQSVIQDAKSKYDKWITDLMVKMITYTARLNTTKLMESLFDEMRDRAHSIDKQVEYLQREFELSKEKAILMWVDLMSSEQTSPGHKFTVILTITLFESFFTQLLKDLIIKNKGTYELAEYILDILFSYKAHLELFNKLTNDSFEQALGNVKASKEYRDKLVDLRRKRNIFIHGNPWAISRVDSQDAFDFALNSVVIFKDLNNKYCAKSKI